jgi:hypothetical protein
MIQNQDPKERRSKWKEKKRNENNKVFKSNPINSEKVFGGKSREEASPMAQSEESSQSWDVGKK